MPRTHRLGLIAGLVLLPLAWPGTARSQETYELSGDRAAIWNLAGSVTVSGGGSVVTVEVRRGGPDADRLEIGTGPVDLDRHDAGRVEGLRVVYPADEIVYGEGGRTELRVRDDGTFFRDRGDRGRKVKIHDRGGGLEAHADLDIRVPAGHTVLVFLAVGDVAVSNVNGDLVVDVASADITATDTRGHLVLDTGSGDIELDGASGEVTLDTGSGDIAVRNVRDGNLVADTGSGDVSGGTIAVGSLNVDTGSGDVKLSDVSASEVLVDTGSGDVEIGFLSEPRRLSFDTGSGGVRLTLPDSWSGRVELDTGSGSIHSDFRMLVEEMDDDYVSGRIGEGGGSLEVDTGSGNITLLKG